MNCEGKRSEYHQRCRDHVGGQSPSGEIENLSRVDYRARFWHHVTNQPVAAAVTVPHMCNGRSHVVVCTERRFDLAEFDAVTTDLHL